MLRLAEFHFLYCSLIKTPPPKPMTLSTHRFCSGLIFYERQRVKSAEGNGECMVWGAPKAQEWRPGGARPAGLRNSVSVIYTSFLAVVLVHDNENRWLCRQILIRVTCNINTGYCISRHFYGLSKQWLAKGVLDSVVILCFYVIHTSRDWQYNLIVIILLIKFRFSNCTE